MRMSKVDISKPVYKELVSVADEFGFREETRDGDYVKIAQQIKEILKCEDKTIYATELASEIDNHYEEIIKILSDFEYPVDKCENVLKRIKEINVEKVSDLKNLLCVIQSLNTDDERTGELLIYNLCCKYEFRDILFCEVRCEEEMRYFLDNIEKCCKDDEWVFLSIETHGELGGILLNDGEDTIPWNIFFNEVKALNKKSKMHLVLLSSMCYGSNFFEIIKYTDNGEWVAPFRWFFGPNKEEEGTKILRANMNIISSILNETEIEVEKKLNEDLQSLTGCSSYAGVNVCDLVMHIYAAMVSLYLNPSFLRDRFEKRKGEKIENAEEESEFLSNFKQDRSKKTQEAIFKKLWKTMLLDTESFLGFNSDHFFKICWSALAKKYDLQ